MAIDTKSVNRIPILGMKNELELRIWIKAAYNRLNYSLAKLVEKNKWLSLDNDAFYYINEDKIIIPNTSNESIKLSSRSWGNLGKGMAWTGMKFEIAEKWFLNNYGDNPLIKEKQICYYTESSNKHESDQIYIQDKYGTLNINNNHFRNTGLDLEYSVKIPLYKLDNSESLRLLYFFLEHDLDPFSNVDSKKVFYALKSLLNNNLVRLSDNKEMIVNSLPSYGDIMAVLSSLDAVTLFTYNNEDAGGLKSEIIDEPILEYIKKQLLDCDKLRINMESYPNSILTDPESGHWDLWLEDSETLVSTVQTLVARNPVYDALNNKSGVIGIDFGTKSTVVTYRQARADILLMRIGSGQYSRAVSKKDYENPTVMELRNVKKFVEAYEKSMGRPDTRWEYLLISHEAAEQLKSEQSKGDTFATFFSELKQWAGDKTRQVHLRDQKGNELSMPPYMEIADGDFDPIEIYAYYLGLFINNMVHSIYLRYRLSFPATAEKGVRDKILKSFTRGIKKSLPIAVLQDEKCMRLFKVEQGASEPAAYAITALYGYGFDPEGDDKYYYGIFDFGGGTTDFDFGVWSEEADEPENYDYQISHFGQGGNPYLGGENLLEILSYHVFIKNYDKLLQDRIVFIRPYGEKEVAGKDYLVCKDSQYAHFNHKRMMEKLRGVWEGDKEIRENVESGTVSLPLFTMEGESKGNYNVEVDLKELDQLLEERIDAGVGQFFDAMKNCFGTDRSINELYNVDRIHIFLAGNSSKSPIVYKIFKKYIDLHKERLAGREREEQQRFLMYPPLGSYLSKKLLKGEINPDVDEILNCIDDDTVSEYGDIVGSEESADAVELSMPTGKTGVAFGLLNNRVRVVQNESEEVAFMYYIGQNRKNRFYCVIDRDRDKYNEWKKFSKASREDFDIWFTRSAAAPSNKLAIDEIGVYSETGFVEKPNPDKYVYIRLVSPTEIEYVVAAEEEISSGISEYNITKVSLQEKQ